MITDLPIATGNLPTEPNSFIGRERDLAELAQLLAEVRVLTLCGPGGIGKTRLALRLAREITPRFPGGAWLVELGDARGDQVTRRAAAALGIREEAERPLGETLAGALHPRHLLLILDTCEHLIYACAELVQLLVAGCPWLSVIVTSREPLRVRGETVWRVPPLALPRQAGDSGGPAADLGSADLESAEAVRLFTDRATAVCPGFALDHENVSEAARICQTLDGIPLAIELAAARARALSVGQIAGRLSDRFQLLASGDRTAAPRHQTLRATVDWSYELLTRPEQVLLRRLAVFAGWSVEMAEQVCSDGEIPVGSVLDLLVSLIDKSLVSLDSEEEGDARYRLLDTIKEYATARLAASSEERDLRLRHRDYVAQLVRSIEDRAFLRGDPPRRERMLLYRRVVLERDNCLAALAVTLEWGHAEEGLLLCIGLRSQWITHGDAAAGASWFDRFLGLSSQVSPEVRGRALVYRAELAFELQDYPTAQECAEAGLELSRSSGDGATTAAALRMLGQVSMRAGRFDEAVARLDEAIAAARGVCGYWEEGLTLSAKAAIAARQGRLREAQQNYEAALDALRDNNPWGLANIVYGMGGLARARGDHANALRYFEDALAICRELDARPEAARCLAGIGWVALRRGDLALARSRLAESLRLSLATGQRLAIARGLEALAAAAVMADDPGRAVRLAGSALELREAAGKAQPADAAARLESLLGPARERLGVEAMAALLAAGREMTADEAVSYATGQRGAPWGDTALAEGDTALAEGDTAPPGTAPSRGQRSPGGIPPGPPTDPDPRDPDPDGPPGGIPPGPPTALDLLGQDPDGPFGRTPRIPTAADPAGWPRAPDDPRPAASPALTRRELEIAALIARGLSNRAIADELVISPATAARHVANILAKLGFSSRTQVAAWAAGRRTR